MVFINYYQNYKGCWLSGLIGLNAHTHTHTNQNKRNEFIGKSLILLIPREWKGLADRLAVHGRSEPALSLFHQGRDLQRSMMKTCSAGFFFNFRLLRLF